MTWSMSLSSLMIVSIFPWIAEAIWMESRGLRLYLSIRAWAWLRMFASALVNSKFGKPSSFWPWFIPSLLPSVLLITQTTSCHVSVDVYAGCSPFSMLSRICLAFFAFGSASVVYSTG